jgi:hypothetical protein
MALTKYEKMAYMRGSVESWLARGFGSGQAYNEYMGIRERLPEKARIRKTDFLSVYREWKGEERKRVPFKALRWDYKPKEGMVERTFMYAKHPYTYEGRVMVFNFETGEYESRKYRIGYDILQPKSMVEADVLRLWDQPEYDEEAVALTVDRILGIM